MALIPYLDGAEPYFHAAGPLGCLVIHGFTASPDEVRWLAQHLASQGHTVYAPRLAGHGTTPADLLHLRWRDWYAAALDGYHLLAQVCERVCVVGHSMGGLLALLLASDCAVTCAAALAAPIEFKGPARQARWLHYVMPFSDQSDRTDFPAALRAEQARRGEPVRGRVRYDRWATRGVAQLCELAGVTRGRLAAISAPLLLVYSAADPTVPTSHAAMIAGAVGSAVVERHELQGCGHILPQDSERERVFQLVGDFVGRHG